MSRLRLDGRSPKRQRGVAVLMIAIAFLIMVGYAAIVMTGMGATSVGDGNLGTSRDTAQMAAESGIERAIYRFKNGTACTALAPDGPFTLNGGQVNISSGVLEGSNCRITAVGTSGRAKITLSAITKPSGFFYDFIEHYPSSSDFSANYLTRVFQSTEGSAAFSVTNCTACAGASGGSLLLQTNSTGSGDVFSGYIERPIPLIATGTGVTINFSVAWKKYHEGTKVTTQTITLYLVSSSTGQSTQIWFDNTKTNSNVWTNVVGTAALPGNRSYDRLRIDVSFHEFKFNQASIWIDEVHLWAP